MKGLITQRDNYEQKLKDLNAETKRDENSVDFERLGIDCICADEAHNYKSIMTPTKLDIKGLVNRNNAQIANDMLMKLDYLRSVGGKIIFGTGTPITNTVSEIYNMMRMVRPDILEDADIHSLDEWVNTFAKIDTVTEIGIDNQIKAKSTQIIRSFVNVSEMVGMFRQFADVVFTKDVVKDLPKAKYIDIEIDGTPEHKQIEENISKTLAKAPRKDLLKIHGQLMAMADVAAVDLRMLSGAESTYNPFKSYSKSELEYENSKINTMCNVVYDEYQKSSDIKGTQIIFCDKGSGSGTVYSFNLHKDIMQKLIDRGIPKDEIVIIKDQNDAQLEALYEKVNNGEVRVLIGTSQKMAEGLNVQKRVVAIHHPTVTYKPSDKEQGDARGVRSGNINSEVRIYRYLQKNTFDSHKWQAQDRKGEMINRALRGDVISEMEDIGADDEGGAGVDAATAMAITSGNPLVKEKIDIDKEVSRLKTLQRNYLSERYRYEDAISKNPGMIRQLSLYAENLTKDIALRNQQESRNSVVIGNKTFEKTADANKALVEAIKKAPKNGKLTTLGTFKGFDITFKGDTGGMDYVLALKGSGTYSVEYAAEGNNIARFSGVLNRLDSELIRTKEQIGTLTDDLAFAKEEVAKPFEKEKELNEALAKQKDVTYRYEHYSEMSTKSDSNTINAETAEEKYSIESEDLSNGRSNLLSRNGGRSNNESTGKQIGTISDFEREVEGRKRAERESFSKTLLEQGHTKEVIDGKHKYNLVDRTAYNDDMRAIAEDAKKHGLKVEFFVGECLRKFDGKRNLRIDGIKLSDSAILLRYDGQISPQKLLKHEKIHADWNSPEFQTAKNAIFDSLTYSEKKEILSKERYKTYAELYGNNQEAVWEEFFADVFSGLNEYTKSYADSVVQYWNGQNTVDRYSAAEYNKIIDSGDSNAAFLDRVGFENGIDLAEKYSYSPKPLWHTDLSEKQLTDLMEKIQRDLVYSPNKITDTANWYESRLDGKPIFAIYSTEDKHNPTLLYESRGDMAKIEKRYLLDLLEVETNNENTVQKSGNSGEVLGGDRLSETGVLGDNAGHGGRGSGNRNAEILPGKSQRKPCRAFRNVLNNLLEIRSRESAGRGTLIDDKYSISQYEADKKELTPERKKEIFEQFEKDRAGVQKVPMSQWFGERAQWVAHNMTRVFPNIPERGEKGVFFAEFRKQMVQWKNLPQTASFMVQDKLNKMTEGLSPKEFKTFSELVYFLDLQEEAQIQKERGYEEILLPNGITPGEVDEIVKVLNDEATDKVRKALDRRKNIWNDLKSKYISLNQYIGFDTDDKFKRKNYYHHQVIDYIGKNKGGTGGRSVAIKAGRGWLKERQGSSKAINTDFLAVEYEAMLQMQYDVYIADTLGAIKRQYDIKPRLEKEALGKNKSALNAVILKEATAEDGTIKLDSKGKPDSETYRKQMWFNTRIMTGFSDLFELAKHGKLPTFGETYTNVIDALAAKNLNVPGLYKYIGLLAGTELTEDATYSQKQAVISSRTVLKFTSQKREWIKGILGAKFQTWETLAKSMSDTHTIHQPRRGNYFFTKTVVDEDAFNKAYNDMVLTLASGEANGGNEEMSKLFNQYADTVRLTGAAYEQWVLPNEIVSTMDEVSNPKQASYGAKAARAIVSAWKGWATTENPLRTVKFGIRNLYGDLDAVVAGKPQILQYSGKAIQEIRQAMKHKKYSSDMLEWIERGGYTSMLFANEMDTEMQEKLFSYLQEKKSMSALKIPSKLVEKYKGGVEYAHNFREAILRYSAYLYFKNEIQKNNGEVKDYVASNRYIVNGLTAPEDKAYQLSKDLLGAYDEVGKLGQTLRRYWIPFYSFTETNAKRYYRMFENIITSNDKIPMKVGKLLLKGLMVNWLGLLVAAWNNLVMKEADEKLPPSVRKVPHITFGSINGETFAFRQVGSFSELLEWVGLEDYKWTKEDLTAPIDKIWGMITPFVKMPVEQASGLNFYPSITQPRAIRDKWQHFFNSLGVDSIYSVVAGKPTRGVGEIIKGAFIYSYDDKESAYYEILDIKRNYQGKTDNTIYGTNEKSNALYYMKTAIRYKDKKAALKYLDQYFENGGTAKGIKQSIAALSPMYGFTSKDTIEKGEEFIASLTDEQKEKLQVAQDYYENDLMLPENVSNMLGKKDITDEEAKNVLRNYISAKCK